MTEEELFNTVVSELNNFDYSKKRKFMDLIDSHIKRIRYDYTYKTDKLKYLMEQESQDYTPINKDLINMTYIDNNTIHLGDICSIKYYVDDSNHPIYYCLIDNKYVLSIRRYYTKLEEDNRRKKIKLYLSEGIKNKLTDKNIIMSDFVNFMLKVSTIDIISDVLNYTITYNPKLWMSL